MNGKNNKLTKAGFPPKKLTTLATVSLEQKDNDWSVNAVHLKVNGKVPGIDAAGFAQVAEEAKAKCPISRLLKATITLEAKLEA